MISDEVRRRTAEVRGRDRVARTAVPRQVEQVEFLTAHAEQLAELRRDRAPAGPPAGRPAGRAPPARQARRAGHAAHAAPLAVHRRGADAPGLPRPPPRPPGAGRAVRRLRLGGRVQPLHAAAGAGAARAVQPGPGVRVRGAGRRGHPPVRAGRRAGRGDDAGCCARPSWSSSTGTATTAARSAASPSTGATRSARAVSLLVLGDARTNYRDPNLAVLGRLVGQARHAHWLNPEPRRQWGSGDSAALRYAEVLPMHECRTAGPARRGGGGAAAGLNRPSVPIRTYVRIAVRPGMARDLTWQPSLLDGAAVELDRGVRRAAPA